MLGDDPRGLYKCVFVRKLPDRSSSNRYLSLVHARPATRAPRGALDDGARV